MTSVYSQAPADKRIAENEHAYALEDKYPMSPGHSLVIPRREFASWFDATPEEHAALMALVADVKGLLDAHYAPTGYRIMINDGSCQHIRHLHVHLIPSYTGSPDRPGFR